MGRKSNLVTARLKRPGVTLEKKWATGSSMTEDGWNLGDDLRT